VRTTVGLSPKYRHQEPDGPLLRRASKTYRLVTTPVLPRTPQSGPRSDQKPGPSKKATTPRLNPIGAPRIGPSMSCQIGINANAQAGPDRCKTCRARTSPPATSKEVAAPTNIPNHHAIEHRKTLKARMDRLISRTLQSIRPRR
jgi:hypothetical protein